jgi:hypothetical protein
MSAPIYQLFIGKNNTAGSLAWEAMPEAERKALEEKERVSREGVGTTTILMCSSAWADEEHPWWGVLRFPSLEARIQHARTLGQIGWLGRIEAFTLLGTSDSEPAKVEIPSPIYKLWLIKSNPAGATAGAGIPKGLSKLMWEKHNALYQEYKSQIIMSCSTVWCNEAYAAFGVCAYPNIEANMRIMEGLGDLGWPHWFEAFSLLGTSP